MTGRSNMKLYHFLKKEHGLSAIRDQRVKIARIADLNDPFEYMHFDTSGYVAQAVLKERKRKANQKYGLVCLRDALNNPPNGRHPEPTCVCRIDDGKISRSLAQHALPAAVFRAFHADSADIFPPHATTIQIGRPNVSPPITNSP